MKKAVLSLLALSIFSVAVFAAPVTFKADPNHSGVTFKIRHFFTTVPGSFGEMDATIVYDASDVASSKATASIAVVSVDTNNEKRDAHLADEDFFDSDEFPAIEFESTSWESTGENTFSIKGDLTMAGETKPVTLEATLLGIQDNADGVSVSGWEATTKIDRRDWGISYGQGIVGNEVTIEIFLQAPAV
ncbi:MAG: YceI family protein [Verrucomicrobiota bacterium]